MQLAQAAVVTKVNTDALAPLREARTRRVRLDRVPLYDSSRSVIELEEFDVWTPGAKVAIHSPDGVVKVDPPAMRFYRGRVNGDVESFAYFSVDLKTQHVEGLVTTRDGRYAINSARRPGQSPRGKQQDFDDFLTEVDGTDLIPGQTEGWQCAVDRMRLRAPEEEPEQARAVDAEGLIPTSQGITGTQSYAITLGIETDFAFFQNAGSNSTTATNYVTNLTGALATIYKRDLDIEVRLSYANIYTTDGVDPWNATDAFTGLTEVGDQYHNNILNAVTGAATLRTTSAVIVLSGEDVGSGIAWEGVIGGNDFFQGGHWGGPYSWCGGIGRLFGDTGLGTIPNPDGSNSQGTQYGNTSGLQNYWPLVQYAHELGHTLAGHHTHCSQISDAERIAAGFTDGSPATYASNQIDHCFGGEGITNCFSGANYQAGSQSIFKGTLMSYCHNVFQSSVPQSRFIFGVAGEPSIHELNDYMLRSGGPVQYAANDGRDGGSRNIVNAVGTFTSSISAPETVTPDSTGNVASVTAAPSTGATYFWTIVNGSITAGAGTNSITFTAGSSGAVELTATAYNDKRVGIMESVEVTIVDATVDTPTGVVATPTAATSVLVTWNAAAGAASYDVLRSTGGAFTVLGSTTIDLFFNDNTAAANTAYRYAVQAHGAGVIVSDLSVPDVATTTSFTDPTITALSTTAKVIHFTELLTVINSLRSLAGLSPISFTAPGPAPLETVRRQHILDLRAGLDAARTALGMSALTYTDPTLTAGSTKIKAVHVTELRAGVN
ncbi:MAG TPA: M12 family metallo-peptidase [Thermoanaerobaculia bacterium]|nr:M12 family metallo-peptidase [Thermoanaerobaculia bacterium]